MSTRPLFPLLLPLLLGMALLAGCKKEQDAPAGPPPFVRPTFLMLNQLVKTDPAQIPLVAADGTQVTLGQVATGRVVVVVPWVAPQTDAQDRIRTLRDALKDLDGVQILPINSELDPTEEHLAELMQQSQLMGLPYYVDAQVELVTYLNEHLRVRAKNRNVMQIPQYVIFTHNLRQIAIDVPSQELEKDATTLVTEAIRAPELLQPAAEETTEPPVASDTDEGTTPPLPEAAPDAAAPATP